MKKMWKRFWTLSKRQSGGFTLVELIVVIAILAILAGVGVPVYSGYVTKANMQADMTLVSDVMYAVELYSYSENLGSRVTPGTLGYVILTEDEVLAQDTMVDESGAATTHLDDAMRQAFGEAYATSLKLQYSGWEDAATMLNAATNPYASSVNGSTFFEIVGTEALLGDVQNCSSKFAEFLSGNWAGTEGANALIGLLGGTSSDGGGAVNGMLGNYKDDEITAEVLANATVFGVAGSMKGDSAKTVVSDFGSGKYVLQNYDDVIDLELGIAHDPLNVSDPDVLTQTANTYAALEALVGYLGDETVQEYFDGINMTGRAQDIAVSISTACNNIVDYALFNDIANNNGTTERFVKYYDLTNLNDGTNPAQQDGEAYVSVMQTVNQLNTDYVDSLANEGLFSGTEMADRVNSYVAAAGLHDALTSESGNKLLKEIADGSYDGVAVVIVFNISSSGVMVGNVCPAYAMP